jgi:hypothetical protein
MAADLREQPQQHSHSFAASGSYMEEDIASLQGQLEEPHLVH